MYELCPTLKDFYMLFAVDKEVAFVYPRLTREEIVRRDRLEIHGEANCRCDIPALAPRPFS